MHSRTKIYAARAAAAAIDRYLLPAPDLSSEPVGRRRCCTSTRQTDRRTDRRTLDRLLVEAYCILCEPRNNKLRTQHNTICRHEVYIFNLADAFPTSLTCTLVIASTIRFSSPPTFCAATSLSFLSCAISCFICSTWPLSPRIFANVLILQVYNAFSDNYQYSSN